MTKEKQTAKMADKKGIGSDIGGLPDPAAKKAANRADDYNTHMMSVDMMQLQSRIAAATPRMYAWANGAKTTVRAGLYVSRAKTLAGYALMMGMTSMAAVRIMTQLTTSDPTRENYRVFINDVAQLLEELNQEAEPNESD